MKINATLLSMLLLFGLPVQLFAQAIEHRYFLFVGEPNATGWQLMVDDPADREAAVVEATAAIGGEILSYYFGLGNGKNYITMRLPNDNEVIQAVYLMRLTPGVLKSYEVIELMPSSQMTRALEKVTEFIELEQSLGGGVN